MRTKLEFEVLLFNLELRYDELTTIYLIKKLRVYNDWNAISNNIKIDQKKFKITRFSLAQFKNN